MAIEYYADVATDLSPSEIIALLSRALKIARHGHGNELEAPGVSVRAFSTDELSRSATRDDFQFTPTVTLGCRVDKDPDSQREGPIWVVRICNAILKETPGDVVLLYNGDVPILLRRAKRLVLVNDRGFWTKEWLAQIDVPYTLQGTS